MAIQFHNQTKEFHLNNGKISYIFQVLPTGQLTQLYFGSAVPMTADYSYLYEQIHHPMASYITDYTEGYDISLEHTRQEYPAYGTGDYRLPAVELRQANGSTITDFRYVRHEIEAGKPKLINLPATYTEDPAEAETLTVYLHDDLTQVTLALSYTLWRDFPVIMRNAHFVNHGTQAVTLTHAMSLSLDLPDANYDWLQFSGAWGRERHLKSRPLTAGIQSVGSTCGASSHTHNPFVILKRPHTTERTGEALGLALVYSGNFLAQAEVDNFDVTRLMIGIQPHGFAWYLAPQESFQTPEAVLAYTKDGLSSLSQTFHTLFRTRLARGYWRDRERPVLINNWEATGFDFDEETLVRFAQKAKDAGVELFVLDDGWFSSRESDTCGLGDWWSNPKRLPHGIKGLAERIEAIGMKFGLWVELEMVNKGSELYQKHPDWILHTDGRHDSHGRHQYVLDFGRAEVVDYLYDSIVKVIQDAPISYIKWDMNRSITEAGSKVLPPERQGEVMHRYILGVYALYERLIAAFPHILFESCASGGGRFDAGMLYYAPQAWTSDDSDAIERLSIQYGTSFGYPISSMGAHVSVSPNQQLNRITPLKTRADVAYFGAFGYELDLQKLSEDEFQAVKEQIKFIKQYRRLIHTGDFYRLASPFSGNVTAWAVVSKDKRQAIVFHCRIQNDVNAPFRRLKLAGLAPDLLYTLREESGAYYGRHFGCELENVGLVTSDSACGQPLDGKLPTDFTARLWVLTAE